MRVVSLNLCGFRKLAIFPLVLLWLQSFAVIFLQETLDVNQSFQLPGFSGHFTSARPTDGRASGGLSTFFNNRFLGQDSLVQIDTGRDWVLASHVSSGTNPGTLLFNVYIPK